MLQVSRNAQGEEAISEKEQALAEARARTALAEALRGLCPLEEGSAGRCGTCLPAASEQGDGGGAFANGGPGSSLGEPCAQDDGSGAQGCGFLDPAVLVFKPQPALPPSYTMVMEGDDLAAAAAGLHTGYVRADHSSRRRGGVWGILGSGIDDKAGAGILLADKGGACAAAGTAATTAWVSSVQGQASGAGDTAAGTTAQQNPGPHPEALSSRPSTVAAGAVAGQAAAAADNEPVGHEHSAAVSLAGPDMGRGLPLFVPGRGEVDVDAVERYMVGLLRVPGAGREGMEDVPAMDAMARSLKHTQLKVGGCRGGGGGGGVDGWGWFPDTFLVAGGGCRWPFPVGPKGVK